jgi:predicted RNA-binding protein with RPS1 domain
MSTINVYNFLDGANLCNIFANLIVLKIKESFPDAKTEISVINVRNFFIIKGQTTSETLINIAEIFQDFLNNYNEELSKKVRVFDMILYGKEFDDLPLNISYKEIKKESIKINNLQKTINNHSKNKIYFNIKLDELSKIVFFDCQNEQYSDVKNILEKEFVGYELIKHDFSNETYISEKIYGQSMHNEKPYLLLFKFISDHLFKLGISKEVDMSISSVLHTKDITNENINLIISNDNHIVKREWLESLVMDVFPFELEKLKIRFSDCDDLTSFVIDSDTDNYSVSDLSIRHEMILI